MRKSLITNVEYDRINWWLLDKTVDALTPVFKWQGRELFDKGTCRYCKWNPPCRKTKNKNGRFKNKDATREEQVLIPHFTLRLIRHFPKC